MDAKACHHCNRRFSSSSNRLRHEKYFHRKDVSESTNDPELRNTMSPSSEVETENSMTTEDDNDDDDDDDDNSQEVDDDDDEESIAGSDDSDESCADPWRELISETCEQADIDVESAEQVLQEPYLSEFLEMMGKILQKKINMVKNLQEKDATYEKVQSTIDRCTDKDYDDDEAFEKAWDKRKFLLKKVLKNNLDLIEEKLINNSEEEDESYDDEQLEED